MVNKVIQNSSLKFIKKRILKKNLSTEQIENIVKNTEWPKIPFIDAAQQLGLTVVKRYPID